MSIRSIERRLDDLERALSAKPTVIAISGVDLSADGWRLAIREARHKAGLPDGALADEFMVTTGVQR